MVAIVGGKLDGSLSPLKVVSFQEGDEQYQLIEYKEIANQVTTVHRFYMLAGMAPADAQKIYRDRRLVAKGIRGK